MVATKFGTIKHSEGDGRKIDGSPDNLRASIEGSLRRLGTDHIDLYYQHRMDPEVPIEDTVGALADLITAGKIRGSDCPKRRPRRSGARTPFTR